MPSQDKHVFEKNDVVEMIGIQSPVMLIREVRPDGAAHCIWFNTKLRMLYGTFPVDQLELIVPAATVVKDGEEATAKVLEDFDET